jgi:transcriptional regulator with XRE-family HTH domain
MILGEMIQAWREKNNMSRRKLALSMGVDHVTLSRIEKQDTRAISVEVLGKIYAWQLSNHVK